MAKTKIEDLSTDGLIKRKKLATWLMWVDVIAGVICLGAAIFDFIQQKELNFILIAVGFGCITVAITLLPGIRKIQEVIKNRS
jgi:hypothetical protein